MAEALVPTGSLPVTLALAQVNAGRPAAPAHLVADVGDPRRCPAELLGYLAWARSVDVWDEEWSERKKRYVIGRALLDHRLKGTLALLERYVDYAGGKVIDVVAPPQRFVLGRARTPEDLARLFGRLPEIRIYANVAPRPARGSFWGQMARGGHGAAWGVSRADADRETRAVLLRDGKVTTLAIAQVTPSNLDDDTAPFERLFIPRSAPRARTLGRLRPRQFWTNSQASKFVVSFVRTQRGLGRSAVRPGLAPIEADPERVRPKAPAPAGKAFVGRRRWRRAQTGSIAAPRIYDRLRLWDDEANVSMPKLGSFWGVSRRGAAALTAIVSIELQVRAPRRKRFYGGVSRRVFLAHDAKPLDLVKAATTAARLPHERILIDLATAFERRLYGAAR